MAKTNPSNGPQRSARFQTAITGTYVPTATGARFDPYQPAEVAPKATTTQMETIALVRIPD